ncbi:MAG: alpha-amylase/4-alpha-glucanotransferase domain-containing protein [Candidatus Eisenbacteria bacterium]
MKTIRFALALHAHQPTGNFDHVFREAYETCYLPFLEEVEKHPAIPFTLHYSGILLEWLEKNAPEYLDRLKPLVKRGQVELLGGGFGEPILVMLSDRDRLGQIRAMSAYLEERFGGKPRGAWLTERVWEQCLAHDLAAAGVRYTMVDDSLFRLSGLRGEEMLGSFTTEDRGETIRVFPLSEALRYHIPFKTVEETIRYIESLATEEGDRLIVYGDDTEKFGGWPGTHEHVYVNGWLARFLDAVEENRSWIRLVKLSDALALPPSGKVYLPDASYREMTEWALPARARIEYAALREEMGEDLARRAALFFRGAQWRSFLAKYPEAAEMHGKMAGVSRRVAALPAKSAKKREAEMELYRGQTNCAYWHGVFGGLYLPHLRSAIYGKLIAAEAIAERAARGTEKWADVETADLDLDGNEEVRLSTDRLVVAAHPRRGGQIYEIDDRERSFNLVATMTRREEAYHERVRRGSGGGPNDVASIHDRVVSKETGLEELLVVDPNRRATLVDHFFAPGAALDDVAGGDPPELGDFASAPYGHEIERKKTSARVRLSRLGSLRAGRGEHPVLVEKKVKVAAGSPDFEVRYRVENKGRSRIEALFAVEFAYALLAGNAPDRYLVHEEKNAGPLASRLDLSPCRRVGAKDEWLGLFTGIEIDKEAPVWVFPIRTVSLSEGGFESVYQCTMILPRWRLALDPGEEWTVGIRHFLRPARGG